MSDFLKEEQTFQKLAESFRDKLSKIKVILLDVDGIQTNGHVIWVGGDAGFTRTFQVHDGYGMALLMRNGFKVGFVTGGDSPSVRMRAKYLGIQYMFLGDEDKRNAFKKVMADGYAPEEILYMGDELFDLPLLKKAGFSACPPEAVLEVRKSVDYITQKSAGQGCVREVIDLLRFVQKIEPELLEF